MNKPHRAEIHARASWLRRRNHHLRIEPLCRIYLEASRVTPASVADHVNPHRGDSAFRLGALRSLCKPCHDSLSADNRALVRSRLPVRADGTPSEPKPLVELPQLMRGNFLDRSQFPTAHLKPS